MLYRIRFFSSCVDSEKCKPEFERLYETDQMENYGPDKDIYIVNDDSYTHAIIMNTATPPLTIPKENVVGLAFEPTPFLKYMTPMLDSNFVNFAQKYIGKYLRTNDNRSFFQEDNGKKICIVYSNHTIIYFIPCEKSAF